MADNFAVSAGSGITIAADDISSVYFQRVKVCWGVDGTGNDTSATNPLPVANTNCEFAEDAAHTTGDKGLFVLSRAVTAAACSAGTSGDYATFNQNMVGQLYVTQLQGGNPVVQYNASITATGTTDAGANLIYGLYCNNANAAAVFLKIYDKATAATESDTPILKLAIPASSGSRFIEFPSGIPVTNGISMRATTENIDSGTTGASANEVSVTLLLNA